MFPSALLMARVRKDGVHPVFLGDGQRPQAEAVMRIYAESIGRSRRDIERSIRDLESKVDKYKVVRGLALLVERRCTFTQRTGPEPAVLRRRLFDEAKGAAVTPEERDRVLSSLAPEFGLAPRALMDHLWADLEEEEILREAPAQDAGELLRRFNLGQCQTLLFKATQMSLSFGTPEAYRLAISRIKRQGLMFTAQDGKEGSAPILQVEGVVSFLRSTERYGTRLAQILPDLLSLPGWLLAAKVLYRDSLGKKRHLDFLLDEGMTEYLALRSIETIAAPILPMLEELARSAEGQGFRVDRSPPAIAVSGGLEYPDLALSHGSDVVFVEAVGYWSPAWLEKKLKRTERTVAPYLIVAPRGLAVGTMAEHPRLVIPKASGLTLADLRRHLPHPGAPEDFPRRELPSGSLVIPVGPVVSVSDISRANRIPVSQTLEMLEAHGFLCAGDCAIDRKVLPKVRELVRAALPNFADVERALKAWKLPSEILPSLGFRVKWKGLEPSSVGEK